MRDSNTSPQSSDSEDFAEKLASTMARPAVSVESEPLAAIVAAIGKLSASERAALVEWLNAGGG